MKTLITTITTLLLMIFLAETNAQAQDNRELQYYRSPDQNGLNVFEAPKMTNIQFDGIKVRLGGSNTLQFQGLNHSNSGAVPLPELGSNFNLATSNLDFDVQLHNGLRMHLRTYLSSQHHPEAWVKGGYLQIDRLDFIQDNFMADVMDYITVKVGHMQINYGDNHFRRSDNGAAIHNPFVGNYIMDSFTTEVGGEVYYQSNGILAMVGLTNGKLNQSVVLPDENDPQPNVSFVGKLGYDSQIDQDLRVRFTGSIYTTGEGQSVYLYTGDRAGSRYYNVMEGSFRSGRFNPGFNNELTAIMINPFIKYQGFEFYGVFENSTGKAAAETDRRTFNQYGAELLYRFGQEENVYLGGRYNVVSGELSGGNDVEINRLNIGGGWFMTKNVLAKIEYVSQNYKDFPAGNIYEDGKFDGIMIEAVISF